jgi:PAS domain S-box-containing protein
MNQSSGPQDAMPPGGGHGHPLWGGDILIDEGVLTRDVLLFAHNAPVGFFVLDPCGRFVYCNPCMLSTLGQTEARVLAEHFASFHVDKMDAHEMLNRISTHESSVKDHPTQFLACDGTVRHVELTIMTAPNKHGVIFLKCFARDVTDIVEARRRLEEQSGQHPLPSFQPADETIRKLSEFVSSLCHELKNPLQGLISASEILRSELDSLCAAVYTDLNDAADSDDRQYLTSAVLTSPLRNRTQRHLHIDIDCVPKCDRLDNVVSEALASMQGAVECLTLCTEQQMVVIQDVLSWSKFGAGKMDIVCVPFDPWELVRNMGQFFELPLRQKGSVHMRLQGFPPLVKRFFQQTGALLGDARRLKQILINLVQNALKFTKEGHIDVAVSFDSCLRVNEPKRAMGHCCDGVLMRFTVSDTGIGMTPEEQSRLFVPFTQASADVQSSYGGYGLGLCICQELCRLMHGDIKVDSVKGRGSIFTVQLPLKFAKPLNSVCECPFCMYIGSGGSLNDLGYESRETLHIVPEMRHPSRRSCTSTPSHLETALSADSCCPSSPTSSITKSMQLEFSHVALPNRFQTPRNSAVSLNKMTRILVVDDSPMMHRLMSNHLRDLPHCSVESVYDGFEAVERVRTLLESSHSHFDIIFIDQHMPRMNGYEAISMIREWERDCRCNPSFIVLMSGSSSIPVSDVQQKQVNALLHKPFFRRDLLSLLENVFRHHPTL